MPHVCKATARKQTLSTTKLPGVTGTGTYLINFKWVKSWINHRATLSKLTGGTWIDNAVP